MKRKGHRSKGSVKRGSRNRLVRSKRRKHAKPRKLSRRTGKGRRKGRRLSGKRAARGKRKGRSRSRQESLQIRGIDREGLRAGNTAFRQKLAEGGTIIEWFREVFKLDTEPFLWEMYRQVLQREPDNEGFDAHIKRLEQGTAKAVLAASLFQSEEAARVLSSGISGDSNTAAHVIQSIYPATDLDFIHAIYVQFLHREPEGNKVNDYVDALRQGVARGEWIARLLLSEEAQNLLIAAELPASRGRNGLKANYRNVGIFLCFGSQTTMDGEGIGRFIVRLTEGLLQLEQSYTLHVATTNVNIKEVAALFAPLSEAYRDRIHLYHSDSMDTINRDVPAEVWIVPYVGMALAQYLHKPFIVCLHDLVYLHFPELYEAELAHYHYIHTIAQKVTVNAAAVVFDSEFIRNQEGLSFLHLPAHKTAVVRFAAPREEYTTFGSMSEESFRAKYKLYSPYITFPSVIRLHKNHERLIEAFYLFKQTEAGRESGLQLVFTDELGGRPRQREITAALQTVDPSLRSSVVFLGRIPSADLPSLYKHAVGTVAPTLFEGSCPFPILESLLMDTPVAFGRLEVVQEVISDMSSFATFNTRDIHEMATAILRLYTQGKAVVPMQKAALGGILQRNWSHVANDYSSIIERIAGAAP